MKSLKEQILYIRKVLNERKQRLLEFLDDKKRDFVKAVLKNHEVPKLKDL